jgi:hypothetical protein
LPAKIVADEAEDAALGKGWVDSIHKLKPAPHPPAEPTTDPPPEAPVEVPPPSSELEEPEAAKATRARRSK